MNSYLKHGLILAAIQFVIYITIYFIDKSAILNSIYMWGSYLLSLVYVIYRMIVTRRQNNGILEFGERFKLVFLILLISSFVTFTTQMVLMQLDPVVEQNFQEYQSNMNLKMTSLFQPKMNKYEKEEFKIDAMDQMDILSADSNLAALFISGLFNVTLMVLLLSMLYALFVGTEKMSLKERFKKLNL